MGNGAPLFILSLLSRLLLFPDHTAGNTPSDNYELHRQLLVSRGRSINFRLLDQIYLVDAS